jgi:hypothetical protein
MFSDYINGSGRTIWSYKNNSNYPYSITGIGRDDSTSLYQKQSSSVELDGIVGMAVYHFFENNAENRYPIENNQFLVWSDNGQALSFGAISELKDREVLDFGELINDRDQFAYKVELDNAQTITIVDPVVEGSDIRLPGIVLNESLDNGNVYEVAEKAAGINSFLFKSIEFYMMERKWLMTAFGENISNMPVNLKVDIKNFTFPKENFMLYLAISMIEDTKFKDAQYISVDSIDSGGYAYFSNVYWDIDRSGSDLFTFVMLSPNKKYQYEDLFSEDDFVNDGDEIQTHLYDYKIYPNPTAGSFKIELTYHIESTNVVVNIFSNSGLLVKQFKGNGASYYEFFDYLYNTGNYTVMIHTPNSVEILKLIVEK